MEYHGFLLKSFEEPYMVKEGSFLNGDSDYPTKCSKLVLKKRSERIIEDVSPSQDEVPPVETMKEMRKASKHEPQIVSSVENDSSVQKLDEEMPDSEAILSPKDSKSGKAFKEMLIDVQDSGKDHDMASPRSSLYSFSFPNNMPEPLVTRTDILKSTNSDLIARASPRRNLHSNVDARPLEILPKPAPSESSLVNSFSVPTPVAQVVPKDQSLLIHQEHEDQMYDVKENCQDKEIAEAKLKLFLRFSSLLSFNSFKVSAC